MTITYFLIAPLVFTRLLLDEIYPFIELLFDWLCDVDFRLLACWFDFRFCYNYLTWETGGHELAIVYPPCITNEPTNQVC